ncbi:MAG: type I methionyl aminopeptidase [Phycisphaerae bacterium]|nr:type I methionyl aminopeptidase [Phycisphaerae bacterium]
MHSAGQVVRAALRAAARACVPGASTASVDAAAAGVIAAFRAEPLFLNHRMHSEGPSFPASTCVSVDDEIVHGVPGPRRLRDGELVSIDCGVRLRGWCADSAVTVPVGGASMTEPARLRMLEHAERLLEQAIESIAPGIAWSQIAERLERGARSRGYGIVTDYMGHGIGRDLHEAPQAPNAVLPGFREHDDFTLRPGMTLAIEPMLVLGGEPVRTRTLEDGWTVVVADGRPACHVEHTVAVTHSGVRVLTGPLRPTLREECAFAR